jgi:Uma2 family endonuclease
MLQQLVPVRRRFTIDDYYRMADAGIFAPDDRVELIRGEVVEMSSIRAPHAACVDRLNRMFLERAGEQAHIRIQNPVRIPPDSEPEPDVVLARPRPGGYADRHPEPGEVFLLVEVCETSLHYDREVKGPLYAEAGVPEVWLVDLEHRTVEVYREPETGSYRRVVTAKPGESLAPVLLTDVGLKVDEILG